MDKKYYSFDKFINRLTKYNKERSDDKKDRLLEKSEIKALKEKFEDEHHPDSVNCIRQIIKEAENSWKSAIQPKTPKSSEFLKVFPAKSREYSRGKRKKLAKIRRKEKLDRYLNDSECEEYEISSSDSDLNSGNSASDYDSEDIQQPLTPPNYSDEERILRSEREKILDQRSEKYRSQGQHKSDKLDQAEILPNKERKYDNFDQPAVSSEFKTGFKKAVGGQNKISFDLKKQNLRAVVSKNFWNLSAKCHQISCFTGSKKNPPSFLGYQEKIRSKSPVRPKINPSFNKKFDKQSSSPDQPDTFTKRLKTVLDSPETREKLPDQPKNFRVNHGDDMELEDDDVADIPLIPSKPEPETPATQSTQKPKKLSVWQAFNQEEEDDRPKLQKLPPPSHILPTELLDTSNKERYLNHVKSMLNQNNQKINKIAGDISGIPVNEKTGKPLSEKELAEKYGKNLKNLPSRSDKKSSRSRSRDRKSGDKRSGDTRSRYDRDRRRDYRRRSQSRSRSRDRGRYDRARDRNDNRYGSDYDRHGNRKRLDRLESYRRASRYDDRRDTRRKGKSIFRTPSPSSSSSSYSSTSSRSRSPRPTTSNHIKSGSIHSSKTAAEKQQQQNEINQITLQVKKLKAQEIIKSMPNNKNELFQYQLSWPHLTQKLLNGRISQWVTDKIHELLGDQEKDIIRVVLEHVENSNLRNPFILITEIDGVLDETVAENFVIKLWRLLFYETEARRLELIVDK